MGAERVASSNMNPKNLASLSDSKDSVLGEVSSPSVPKILLTVLVSEWFTEATSPVRGPSIQGRTGPKSCRVDCISCFC